MAEHGTNLAPRQRVFTGRTSGDEEAAIVNEIHEHTQISEKPQHPHHHLNVPDTEGMYRFWHRFTRKGKKNIGVMQSLRAFIFSSCMFIPNPLQR
jgi:Ca2+:H+ antiporter